MASIRKEIRSMRPLDRVWDALRDVGALHTRLVPGFVKDTRMEGNTRVVTFGNGMVAREEIVSVDPAQRRVCLGDGRSPFRHYNGAAWVESGSQRRLAIHWTADLLPDEFAPPGRRDDDGGHRGGEADARSLRASGVSFLPGSRGIEE